MPSLLTIPQEIRDIILELVLTTPASIAPDIERPWSLTEGRKTGKSKALRSWTYGTHVYFPKSSPISPPVFLVNRQLCEEAKLMRARIEANYVLDVIILNEVDLIPTWLLISRPSLCVSNLICNLRIATNYAEEIPSHNYLGFRMGDGAGPAIAWVFYSLLELFIKKGPSWKLQRAATAYLGGERSIRRLIINVETPPGIAPERFGYPKSARYALPRDEAAERLDHVLDPDYLAGFIRSEIQSLLRMEYHTAEYGDFLYEHLETITIQRDSKSLNIFNLTEMLKELRPNYADATSSREQRMTAFNNWRNKAWARRRELGLDVPEGIEEDPLYMNYSQCFHALSRFAAD